jgi:chromate transport protein ChrA
MSLQFTAFNTVAYDDIPSRRMSDATSFYTTFQQMMLSLGICIGALILSASSRIAGHVQPTLDDFSVAFLVVTAISLAASPVSARLPADAGAVMSGHKPRTTGEAET